VDEGPIQASHELAPRVGAVQVVDVADHARRGCAPNSGERSRTVASRPPRCACGRCPTQAPEEPPQPETASAGCCRRLCSVNTSTSSRFSRSRKSKVVRQTIAWRKPARAFDSEDSPTVLEPAHVEAVDHVSHQRRGSLVHLRKKQSSGKMSPGGIVAYRPEMLRICRRVCSRAPTLR